jgi:ubiquinone/menaquinone biosynthesis C-methylase UbiE
MDFDKQSYWHERFSHETTFEWLVRSQDLMAAIEPVLPDYSISPASRVLQLGFGTSDLQNHFRKRGFGDVTNIDYEPLAVERGRSLEEKAFGDVRMDYRVADVTQLPQDLTGQRFNLVIDKSTVDAICCAGEEAFRRMANGVRRLLAPGGVWISLSYSASRYSVDDLPFEVDVIHKFPAPKIKPNDPDIYHWCYLLRPRS